MTKFFGGFTIFAKKTDMKKHLQPTRLVFEILFWAAALYFFLNNAFLRPMQSQAVECAILGMIALVVYAEKYLLTPYILLRNKPLWYVLTLVAAAAAASAVEYFIVKPDIVSLYADSLPVDILNDYLSGVCTNIFLRDSAFICFFVLLHTGYILMNTLKEEREMLSEKENKIVIMLNHNKLTTIDTDKIRYAQCDGNITTIYLKNGQSYKQYVSLSTIEDCLSEDKCLRINRNTLVMLDSIDCYTVNGVFLQGMENPLPYYQKESEKVLSRLLIWNHRKFSKQSDSEIMRKNHDLAGLEEVSDDEIRQIGGIGAEFLEENSDKSSDCEQLEKVIQYIRLHSGCKISDISTGTGFKFRTVERLVHDLKTDGHICYKGSKRYGGYEAVEGGL